MEELISKKEILDITGISYGQLYRWKRKNLIPEEWFIKKSSYTGQETYFPKEKILDRIKKILEFKDDMPLDDLADMFSNKINVNSGSESYVIEKNIINSDVIGIYKDMFGAKENYNFKDMLFMYILQHQLTLGEITIDELELLIDIISREYDKLQADEGKVYLVRKLGLSIGIGAFKEPILLDKNTKVICTLDINKYTEELNLKLAEQT